MVVGVVGEGDVGVEQVGHRGGVQVAGIGVHHQLQLGALRLPGDEDDDEGGHVRGKLGVMVMVMGFNCSTFLSKVLRGLVVLESFCRVKSSSTHFHQLRSRPPAIWETFTSNILERVPLEV